MCVTARQVFHRLSRVLFNSPLLGDALRFLNLSGIVREQRARRTSCACARLFPLRALSRGSIRMRPVLINHLFHRLRSSFFLRTRSTTARARISFCCEKANGTEENVSRKCILT